MVCDYTMIINLFSAPLSQGRFFQNQIFMRRETNMKKQNAMKRIFSMLLCLCMMVSYLPAVAHAAETACICTTACTEDSIDTDCPVCGVEGADLENCTQHSHTQEQEPLETTTSTETVEETLESTMGSTVPKTTDATGVEETVDESVSAVRSMIDALPDVSTATEEELTAAYDAAQSACAAYEALTAEQMEEIDLTKLLSLMDWYNGQTQTLDETPATSGTCGTGVNWTYSNGTLTISGVGSMDNYKGQVPWQAFKSSITKVVIENGVTNIGECAFYQCKKLKSVEIPDTVTAIGGMAFFVCINLRTVTIPDSVTEIGYEAFCNCTNLTSVTIGSGVKKLGMGVFRECTKLASIIFRGTSNPSYSENTIKPTFGNIDPNYTVAVPSGYPVEDGFCGLTVTKTIIDTVTLEQSSAVYNAGNQIPAITAVKAGTVDVPTTDYTVSYKNSSGQTVTEMKNAGIYKVVVTANANSKFACSKEVEWKITKATPANPTTPTATNEISYGQLCSAVTLSDTTNWKWSYPDQVIRSGQHRAELIADYDNYDYTQVEGYDSNDGTVRRNVAVTVKPTTPTIKVTANPASAYAGQTITVNVTVKNPYYNASGSTLPTPACTYQIGAGAETAITGNAFVIPQNTPANTTITIKAATAAKGNDYAAGSGTATVTVIAKADRPAPTGLAAVDETISGKADGKITGVTFEMEYRKENEVIYTAISGGKLENLAVGKYFVRYAEDADHNASPDTEIEIKEGRKLTITLPTEQEGYEMTSTVTETTYGDSIVLFFKLKPGYTKGEKFQISASNGTVTESYGTYILSDITEDTVISVTGVVDTTAPTAEITVKDNSWNKFVDTITFGLFFNEKQDVTITASDAGSGVDTISCYLSENTLTLEQVKALADTDWTEYMGKFSINAERKYVIYAKVTDNWGNATYISSDGLILDMTAPVISGVGNGKTYYTTQKVTASDTYLKSLTGTEADGIIPGDVDKVYIIKATDEAENSTTFTIIMKPISSISEGMPALNTVKISDKTAIEAVKATASNVLASQCANATAEEKAKLEQNVEDCDKLLKAILNAEHAIKLIDAMPDAKKTQPNDKNAIDAYEAAQSTYDKLTENEKRMVGDENKAKLDAMYEALTAYDITKGDGSTWTKGSTSGLTFTANGYFGKFTEIKVDGTTVDVKNYEAQSGSTVITLKASYLQTMKIDKHTIQVIYTDGTTDGADTFTIRAASTTGGNSTTNGVNSPATGDHSNMALWISLLCVSVVGMTALLLLNRKRRTTM